MESTARRATTIRVPYTVSALILAAILLPTALIALPANAQTPTATAAVLVDFNGYSNGNTPWAGLRWDKAGNLYGTTFEGGTQGDGIVFELQRVAGHWEETVIYSFDCTTGCQSVGNVVFDSSGNLYGTNTSGGTNGQGTVFRLIPGDDGSWTQEVLYNFCSAPNCSDGIVPFSGVTLDAEGNVYGTTAWGGDYSDREACTNACGVVYKLSPGSGSSWQETVLYAFKGKKDGEYPYGLVFDGQGRLYGTTSGGSAIGDNYGTVFRLTPSGSSWTFDVLYSFKGQNDGAYPAGAVTLDAAGNLYGAAYGGPFGAGVVFELTPPEGSGSWNEHTLYSFSGNEDGDAPVGAVTFDEKGNLYGATEGEDAYNNYLGSVFELQHSSSEWTIVPLYDFNGNYAGFAPLAGVVLDQAGNVYGTTSEIGGEGSQFGSVYEITP
jgi:uncharacterized repeat protein (TIGR03803 family)